MPDTRTICCPACGSPALTGVQQLTAYAPVALTWAPDGGIRAHWGHARTEVDWDSAIDAGWACQSCTTTWRTTRALRAALTHPQTAARAA